MLDYSRRLEREKLKDLILVNGRPNSVNDALNNSLSALLDTSLVEGLNCSFSESREKLSSDDDFLAFKTFYEDFQQSNNVLGLADLLRRVKIKAESSEELGQKLVGCHVVFLCQFSPTGVEVSEFFP